MGPNANRLAHKEGAYEALGVFMWRRFWLT